MIAIVFSAAAVLVGWRLVTLKNDEKDLTLSRYLVGRFAVLLGVLLALGLAVSLQLSEMSLELIVSGQDATFGDLIRRRQVFVLFSVFSYAAALAALLFQFLSWGEISTVPHIRISLVANTLTLALIVGAMFSAMAWYAPTMGSELYWDPQTLARFVFFILVAISLFFALARSLLKERHRLVSLFEVGSLMLAVLAKPLGGYFGTYGMNLDSNPWL